MYNFFNLIGKIKTINFDKTKITIEVTGKLFEVFVDEKIAKNIGNSLYIDRIIGVTGELALVNNQVVCNVKRLIIIDSRYD